MELNINKQIKIGAEKLLLAVEAIYPPEVFRDCKNDSVRARELVVCRNALRQLIDERPKRLESRENHACFEVVGAGQLAFGNSAKNRCGGAVGVSADCGWSRWEFSGGVMDRSEMIRLRDHLDSLLNTNPQPLE